MRSAFFAEGELGVRGEVATVVGGIEASDAVVRHRWRVQVDAGSRGS